MDAFTSLDIVFSIGYLLNELVSSFSTSTVVYLGTLLNDICLVYIFVFNQVKVATWIKW